MTEALCGPSNALSSFQKHALVDRTLQQDRLVGPRHSPAQGFRSFDPRAGSLDAEFHAFENAPTNAFQIDQPQWHQPVQPVQPFQAPVSAAPTWAADFQNLHISQTPIQRQPFTAPLQNNWQQDFLQQMQTASPIVQGKQPEYASHLSQPSFQQFSSFPAQSNLYNQQPVQQAQPQFDETAFEAAFQDAFQQFEEQVPVQSIPQEQVVEENLIHEPSALKIGSDAISYTEQKDRTSDQDSRDANDLARVAGELVQNISHEQNTKFKNSTFLDLMRRIRDREVEVRNNDFEVSSSSTPVAQTQAHIPQTTNHNQPQTQFPQTMSENQFSFPNMNEVYHPDQIESVDDEFGYNPPRTQITDLHPGGPRYPEQSPKQDHVQMSGAIDERYATA